MKFENLTNLIIIILCCLIIQAFFVLKKNPFPSADGYYRIAFNLNEYKIYSNSKTKPTTETFARAPGFPFFLSFGLQLDNKLKNSIQCFIKYQKECQIELSFYRILQYFLFLITGLTIFFYSLEIGARPKISLLLTVVSLLIISPHIVYYRSSESLAIPLFGILTLSLTYFLRKKQTLLWLVIAASSLALLSLTRVVYYYFYFLIAFFLLLYYVKIKIDFLKNLSYLVIFSSIFGAIVYPWKYKNYTLYENMSISDQGVVKVLGNRIAHNNMTLNEYFTGFLYWTPIIGDNIAKKLLDKSKWENFDTNNTNGFRYQGREIAKKALMKFKTTKKAKEKLILQILSEPFKHFFTSILFFWRGLYYVIIFFPFVVLCIFKYKKMFNLDFTIILLPGILNLLVHSFCTHFNVRYGLPSIFIFSGLCAVYLSKIVLHEK